MKIIILGAGEVGVTLATYLVNENNDITIVDQNQERLRELQDKYDLQVIKGVASHPDVLMRAGAADADMLIAVTSTDETNMIACQIAYTLFNTPNRIARIRSYQYLEQKDTLFQPQEMPIDHLIAPEELVTDYIRRLISYPGALQVLKFANDKVGLVAVKAYYGGALVGNSLTSLRDHIPYIDTRVIAIFRQGKSIKPLGRTVIEADDEVFFIANSINIQVVMSELQKLEKPYSKIMIAGGGNIGAALARQLEQTHGVKLIEINSQRTTYLSTHLTNTIVFNGNATDKELLLGENIEQVDVFIALTDDDETNIMSAILAKRMGAKKVIVLIQKSAYLNLFQDDLIDIVISPQQATISALLRHVRKDNVVNVFSLRQGSAEAIEAIAYGNEYTSQVVGKYINDLKLPPGTTIGAIVRNDQVIIANDNILIAQNDHLIIFLIDKKYVPELETLFQLQAN